MGKETGKNVVSQCRGKRGKWGKWADMGREW
jgi:hypothetical protein